MKKIYTTRRQALKQIAKLTACLSFSSFFLSTIAKAEKCKHLIDMSGKSQDPNNKKAVSVATALKYVENADKADKAGKIKRTSKDAVCANCQFYTKTADDCGKCTLINAGEIKVHAQGWCVSWAKKA